MWDDALAHHDAVVAGKPAAEGLRDYIDGYLSPRHCSGRGGGCPLAALAADVPRLHTQARERFEAGAALLASRIAGLLEATGHPHAGELGVSVLSELVGALVLARTVTDPARAQQLLDASRTQLLRRLGLT
jgi:TetR/AcrR family transcriptional repressor of nem operon